MKKWYTIIIMILIKAYFLNLNQKIIACYKTIMKYYGGIAGLIVFSFFAYYKQKKGKQQINKLLIAQIYYTGNHALFLIGLVAFFIGAATVLQLYTQLSRLGIVDMIGKILSIVIVRELGPIITAFIIISRSGTAIAADIGTMMVNEEVNALEMMGIDPLYFIVFPRIAGMVIAIVLLNIYFNAIGLIGGFIVGHLFSGMTFDAFTQYIMNSVEMIDIFSSVIKCASFGFVISSISIYYGFQAFTNNQIPQMTTKAVVSAIGTTLFVNVIFTLLFNLRF